MRKGRPFTAIIGFCVVLATGTILLGCGNKDGSDGEGTVVDAAALLSNSCTDTCNVAVSCIAEQFLADGGFPLPTAIVNQDLDDCMGMCTEPVGSDLEDEATRDCGIACDISSDCSAYFDCLCDCGIEIYYHVCQTG